MDAPAAKSPESLANRAALWTMTAGALGSLAVLYLFDQALQEASVGWSRLSGEVVKSALYYAVHGAQIACVVLAGALAMQSREAKVVSRSYRTWFWMFLGAGLLMTVRGYTGSELLSSRLFAATGPFSCIISGALFAGASRRNWKVFRYLFVLIATLSSLLVLSRIVSLSGTSRWDAILKLNTLLNVLLWPAAWILLADWKGGSFVRSLRFVPVIVYAFGSVFAQTRLNWVMLAALACLYGFTELRRGHAVVLPFVTAVVLAVSVALVVAVFFSDTAAVERVSEAFSALAARTGEDTRSGQLRAFFADVDLTELVLGRGSLATWSWGVVTWPGGTDVGYLSLLFFGGLPLLATYLAVHIAPAFRPLCRKGQDWRQPCAAVLVLWSVRLFSSSYPTLSVEYYPIILCVGACLSSSGGGFRPAQQTRP